MASYNVIGFIGLGLMGVPMLENLIRKTESHVSFYVYDVVDEPVNHIIEQFPDRVKRGLNAKDIAAHAVCEAKTCRQSAQF